MRAYDHLPDKLNDGSEILNTRETEFRRKGIPNLGENMQLRLRRVKDRGFSDPENQKLQRKRGMWRLYDMIQLTYSSSSKAHCGNVIEAIKHDRRKLLKRDRNY